MLERPGAAGQTPVGSVALTLERLWALQQQVRQQIGKGSADRDDGNAP